MDYRRTPQFPIKETILIPADHWQDVLVGSIIGIVFSYFGYRQYFPNLGSPNSERPYSPRIMREAEQEALPIHTVCLSVFFIVGKVEYT
jgi:hypothetical protein